MREGDGAFGRINRRDSSTRGNTIAANTHADLQARVTTAEADDIVVVAIRLDDRQGSLEAEGASAVINRIRENNRRVIRAINWSDAHNRSAFRNPVAAHNHTSNQAEA